jgi:hypothetical protein
VFRIGFRGRRERSPENIATENRYHIAFREKIIANRNQVIELIVELLRYQEWGNV